MFSVEDLRFSTRDGATIGATSLPRRRAELGRTPAPAPSIYHGGGFTLEQQSNTHRCAERIASRATPNARWLSVDYRRARSRNTFRPPSTTRSTRSRGCIRTPRVSASTRPGSRSAATARAARATRCLRVLARDAGIPLRAAIADLSRHDRLSADRFALRASPTDSCCRATT